MYVKISTKYGVQFHLGMYLLFLKCSIFRGLFPFFVTYAKRLSHYNEKDQANCFAREQSTEMSTIIHYHL